MCDSNGAFGFLWDEETQTVKRLKLTETQKTEIQRESDKPRDWHNDPNVHNLP